MEQTSDAEQRAIAAYHDVVAVEQMAPGLVRVITWSDAYPVDARDAGCNCPDKQYHNADICKHEHAAIASERDDLPTAGFTTEDVTTRVATDGGEQETLVQDTRPEGCVCWDVSARLPCFPCHAAGFESQNPAEPAAE